MTTPKPLTGAVHLVVRPDAYRAGRLVPVKATRGYPSVVDAGCVVVRLTVEVPHAAFRALDGGTVSIGEEQVLRAEVTT